MSTSSTEPPAQALVTPSLAPRGLLWVLCASNFASELSRSFTGLLLPDFSATFAVSTAVAGQLATAMLLTGAVANFFFGILSDLYGRRLFLVVGPLAIGLAAFGLALAPNYPLALAACALGGLGSVNSVAYAAAGDHYRGAGRDRAAARMMGANALAWFIGLPLLGLVAERAGWRAGLQVFAAAAVIVGLATWLAVPSTRQPKGEGTVLRAIGAVWAQHRGRPDVWFAIAANASRIAGFSLYAAYIATFFIQTFGLSTTQAGVILSLGAACVLAGTEVAGRWLPRLGPRTLGAAASVVTAAAAATVLAMTSLSLALTAWLLFGVAFGLASAAIPAQILRLAPASRGTTMALFQALGSAGSALGVAGGGLALATSGFPGVAVAMAAFFLVCAGAVEMSERYRKA